MQTEYDLKSLKVKRRGPLPELASKDAEPAKVRVTIALDADVVEHFKNEAAKPGGLPYQTQINQALRQVMERPTDAESLKRALLRDPEFIREVVEQVRHR